MGNATFRILLPDNVTIFFLHTWSEMQVSNEDSKVKIWTPLVPTRTKVLPSSVVPVTAGRLWSWVRVAKGQSASASVALDPDLIV